MDTLHESGLQRVVERPIWIKITGNAAGTNRYAWSQINETDTTFPSVGGGFAMSGTSAANGWPAYEITGRTDVPTDGTAKVLAYISSAGSFWIFRYTSASSSSLTVQEADGSPSYSSITTLQFNQDDGFVVSQPIAGNAKISYPTVWKQPVYVATTTAGTLATSFENGDTVDGVTLSTGMRILIKNQSTASENGIYTVNASGSPTRAIDGDSYNEISMAKVPVQAGTTNHDSVWQCNSISTLGTDALNWVPIYPYLTEGTGGIDPLTTSLQTACSITIPAGKWWIHVDATYQALTTAGAGGLAYVIGAIYDSTNATYLIADGNYIGFHPQGQNIQSGAPFHAGAAYTVTAPAVIQFQVRKATTETYSVARAGGTIWARPVF